MDELWPVYFRLIVAILLRAVWDWRKTCSSDQESGFILFMLGEHNDPRHRHYTGSAAEIYDFCIPYDGPLCELTSFFKSDWCDLLFSATSVSQDTVLKELDIT